MASFDGVAEAVDDGVDDEDGVAAGELSEEELGDEPEAAPESDDVLLEPRLSVR